MISRNARLNAVLQVEITTALRGVKDPGISGLVTVTGVDLGTDRKAATVYYSVFGDAQQRKSTSKALKRAAHFVRHLLTRRLSLKVIPQIVFEYDETPQRADRIEILLKKLDRERGR